MHKDDWLQPRCVRAVNLLLLVGCDAGHVVLLDLGPVGFSLRCRRGRRHRARSPILPIRDGSVLRIASRCVPETPIGIGFAVGGNSALRACWGNRTRREAVRFVERCCWMSWPGCLTRAILPVRYTAPLGRAARRGVS